MLPRQVADDYEHEAAAAATVGGVARALLYGQLVQLRHVYSGRLLVANYHAPACSESNAMRVCSRS